jgi:phosphosulfolactate synthase (CoM biosynthesis protein A)
MTQTAFSFIPRAARPSKPRKIGLTEIRGPYYSSYGQRHLADLLETVGAWIDGIKYAGGSFALMPPEAVQSNNKLAHDNGVYVSTGGPRRHHSLYRGSQAPRFRCDRTVCGLH